MILRILLIVTVFITFSECKTVMYGEEVTPISTSESSDGVLFVKSWVFSTKISNTRKIAKKNALEKVLFEGIPNSSVKRPLVNNPRSRELNRKYFDDLFSDEGKINRFVSVSSFESKDRIKVPGGWKVGIKCKIMYKALQRDLERNKIIEKFGL